MPGESPWTEEPGGLQPEGSQRVKHDRNDSTHALTKLLFFQILPELYSHYNFSKASVDLQFLTLYLSPDNQVCLYFFLISLIYFNLALQHFLPNILNSFAQLLLYPTSSPTSLKFQHSPGEISYTRQVNLSHIHDT